MPYILLVLQSYPIKFVHSTLCQLLIGTIKCYWLNEQLRQQANQSCFPSLQTKKIHVSMHIYSIISHDIYEHGSRAPFVNIAFAPAIQYIVVYSLMLVSPVISMKLSDGLCFVLIVRILLRPNIANLSPYWSIDTRRPKETNCWESDDGEDQFVRYRCNSEKFMKLYIFN